MSSNVKELFEAATRRGALKADRKNAFSQLRNLSLYGQPEEAAEAQIALRHSGLYQEYVAELKRIISKLSLAAGITQVTADKETERLKQLFSEMQQLKTTSNTSPKG